MLMHLLQPTMVHYDVCWQNDLCMYTGSEPRLLFAKSEQGVVLVAGFVCCNYSN